MLVEMFVSGLRGCIIAETYDDDWSEFHSRIVPGGMLEITSVRPDGERVRSKVQASRIIVTSEVSEITYREYF